MTKPELIEKLQNIMLDCAPNSRVYKALNKIINKLRKEIKDVTK